MLIQGYKHLACKWTQNQRSESVSAAPIIWAWAGSHYRECSTRRIIPSSSQLCWLHHWWPWGSNFFLLSSCLLTSRKNLIPLRGTPKPKKCSVSLLALTLGAALLKQEGFLSPDLAAEGANAEGIPDVGPVPFSGIPWVEVNPQYLKASFTSHLVLYTSSTPRGRSRCL